MKYLNRRDMPAVSGVTTFAVVWIEIASASMDLMSFAVTTFAVVWIEILADELAVTLSDCHHLRGGVD